MPQQFWQQGWGEPGGSWIELTIEGLWVPSSESRDLEFKKKILSSPPLFGNTSQMNYTLQIQDFAVLSINHMGSKTRSGSPLDWKTWEDGKVAGGLSFKWCLSSSHLEWVYTGDSVLRWSEAGCLTHLQRFLEGPHPSKWAIIYGIMGINMYPYQSINLKSLEKTSFKSLKTHWRNIVSKFRSK